MTAKGEERLSTYHWSSCKIAHMRDDAEVGERPRRGRPPKPPGLTDGQTHTDGSSAQAHSPKPAQPLSFSGKVNNAQPADFNPPNSNHDTLTSRQPHPEYIKKGPLITKKMFDDADWPEILQIPSNSRPRRSTRNPSPQYVGSLAWSASIQDLEAINNSITGPGASWRS